MWIRQPQKIKDDIYFIGSSSSPMYLMNCDNEWVLVEGGVIGNFQATLNQLNKYIGDLSLIKHWFILHSHYDHCGMIESLYPYLGKVKIYASQESINNLHKEKFIKKVRELNQIIAGKEIEDVNEFSCNLLNIPLIVVKDKDLVETGEDVWEIITTPGHSVCQFSIYNRKRSVLFASDTLGIIINPMQYFPLPFYSVQQYMDSIKKLMNISSDLIGLGHFGILTGDEAKSAALYSLQSCEEINNLTINFFEEKGIDSTVLELQKRYADIMKDFFPKNIFNKSVELYINHLVNEHFIKQL